jgi:membrane protein implicated in regulation of membrane protease activity
MMGIELVHIYLGFLVMGVGYAVIISFLGSMGDTGDSGGGHDGGMDDGSGGDLHGGDTGDHLHSDGHEGGLSPFSPLMLATFSTLFGGLGFMTMGVFGLVKVVPAGVASIVSILVSASLAIILSSYFSFFLVKLFIKTETSSNISSAKLIGREAEVVLDLEPGRLGEIAYFHGGSRQTNMAKLIDGSPSVKRGQSVEIVSINENIMWVKKADIPEIEAV